MPINGNLVRVEKSDFALKVFFLYFYIPIMKLTTMKPLFNSINPEAEEVIIEEVKEARVRDLVIYNDDENTFDYVIECLVEICKHDVIQAEQCTYIIHYNGQCTVKSDSFAKLKPMKDALIDRGLSAVIK